MDPAPPAPPPRVLVTYATAAGPTAGVAARIADVLRSTGATVTCRPAGPDVEPGDHDAVVVGSAVHDMAWLPPRPLPRPCRPDSGRGGGAMSPFLARPAARAGRRPLGVACGLMSLTAAAGAVGLVGGGIELGPRITSRLPLHSARLGGSALMGLVGLPMGAAALAGWRRSPRTGDLAVAAGAALAGWIVGQVATIRTFSWLQPVCFAYGAGVLGAGLALRHHNRTEDIR